VGEVGIALYGGNLFSHSHSLYLEKREISEIYVRAVPGAPDCKELTCVASLILLPRTCTFRSYDKLCRRDLKMKLRRHESAKR
jgi:hypothetical protein